MEEGGIGIQMSIEQMKAAILKVYPRWKEVYTFADNKVRAVYFSMRDRGSFDQPVESRRTDEKYWKDGQISIFDLWTRDQIIGGRV